MITLTNPREAVAWLRKQEAVRLVTDSRHVKTDDAFIAWSGAAVDGRQFVTSALADGAVAALVESTGLTPEQTLDLKLKPVGIYAGLKAELGKIASLFYDEPSHALSVIAFTGTNGKTSSSWWLAQALAALPAPYAQSCAIVGTLGTGLLDQIENNGLTTPDPALLQDRLRAFSDAGCQAVALEASSIGIAEGRLNGCHIHTAVFTNFTQDHLDYHGTMEAYWQAKATLFEWPDLMSAVINIDDAQGLTLIERLSMKAVKQDFELWTVSQTRDARIQAKNIQTIAKGLAFEVVEAGSSYPLQTDLIGRYNVSNLLGVIGAMRSLAVPLDMCIQACRFIRTVPGRLEVVATASSCEPLVIVDYAHTPDALAKVLQALRETTTVRGGKLWCIFGCGGNRDASKRPMMGATVRSFSDRIVVTSDNPRGEQPNVIISQILLGLESNADEDLTIQVQADRALAIAQTIAQAAATDVIVIAGKGHEDYQEIAGIKYPFSDQAHAMAALTKWRAPA